MSDIAINAAVRHPSRGVGTVKTLVYSYPKREPVKAYVEFPGMGFGKCAVTLPCGVKDLTVVEAARPALRLIEPVVA